MIPLKTVGGRTAMIAMPTSFAALCENASAAFGFDPSSAKLFLNGNWLTESNYLVYLAQVKQAEDERALHAPVDEESGWAQAGKGGSVGNRYLGTLVVGPTPAVNGSGSMAVVVVGKRSVKGSRGGRRDKAAMETEATKRAAKGAAPAVGCSTASATASPSDSGTQRKTSNAGEKNGDGKEASSGKVTVIQKSASTAPGSGGDLSFTSTVVRSSSTRPILRRQSDGGVGKILSAKGTGENNSSSSNRGNRLSGCSSAATEDLQGPLQWPHSPDGLRELFTLFLDAEAGPASEWHSLSWHPTLNAMVSFVDGKPERLKEILAQIQRVSPNFFTWIERHADPFVEVFNGAVQIKEQMTRAFPGFIGRDMPEGLMATSREEEGNGELYFVCETDGGKKVVVLTSPAADDGTLDSSSGADSSTPEIDIGNMWEAGLTALLEELGIDLVEGEDGWEYLFHDSDEDEDEDIDIEDSSASGAQEDGDAVQITLSGSGVKDGTDLAPSRSRRVSLEHQRKARCIQEKKAAAAVASSKKAPDTFDHIVARPFMEELHDLWANERLVSAESAARMGAMLFSLRAMRERYCASAAFDHFVVYSIIAETKRAVEEQLDTLARDDAIPIYAVNRGNRLAVCLPWITSDGHRRLIAALHQYAREEGTTLVLYSAVEDEKCTGSKEGGKSGEADVTSAAESVTDDDTTVSAALTATREDTNEDARRPSLSSPGTQQSGSTVMAFVISADAEGNSVGACSLRSSFSDLRKIIGALENVVQEITCVTASKEQQQAELAALWTKLMKMCYQLYVSPIAQHLVADSTNTSASADEAPSRSVCFVGLGNMTMQLPVACFRDESGARFGRRWPIFQSQSPLDIVYAWRQPWQRPSPLPVSSTASPSALIVSSHPASWLSPSFLKDLRGQVVHLKNEATSVPLRRSSGSASSGGWTDERSRRSSQRQQKQKQKQTMSIVHIEGGFGERQTDLSGKERPAAAVALPAGDLLVLAGGGEGDSGVSEIAEWATGFSIHRAALWPALRVGTPCATCIPAPYELMRTLYSELRTGTPLALALQRAQEQADAVHGDYAPWVVAALTLLHYGGPLRSLDLPQPSSLHHSATAPVVFSNAEEVVNVPASSVPGECVALPFLTTVENGDPAIARQMLVPQPPPPRSQARLLIPRPPSSDAPPPRRLVSGGNSRRRLSKESAETRYVVAHAVDEVYETMLTKLLNVRPTSQAAIIDTLLTSLEESRDYLESCITAKQLDMASTGLATEVVAVTGSDDDQTFVERRGNAVEMITPPIELNTRKEADGGVTGANPALTGDGGKRKKSTSVAPKPSK